ncbi:MAG: GntR family transcriptional regulator [Planctomycetota bacterium]|jgi:DNA-binding LacI/PurR family transcriptional regulator
MAPRRRGRPVSADARYRQIAADLRARVRAGEFGPGAVIPSLRRLAKHYGTSDYTVRMAVALLRREGRIRTSASRQLIAAEPGSARGALDGLILQVTCPSLVDLHRGPYTDELMRGIQMGVGEMEAPFLALHGRNFRDNLPTEALELPVRGIVLFGSFTERVFTAYERLAVPVVLVDHPPGGHSFHSVAVDNFSAARAATSRLTALGHRRLAFVRYVQVEMSRADPNTQEREEGFHAALRDAGLPRSAGRTYKPADHRSDNPEMRALVRATPPFTAVLCASGWRAPLVSIAAEAVGKSVPADMSVVCFQAQEGDYPGFSGPRIDFEEMGRRAAHLLEEPKSPARHVRFPAVWTDAESTAPPPAANQ